jgi:hypothetical protein
VDGHHQRIRIGRDQGAGLHFLAVLRILPRFPQAGEGERLLVFPVDVKRLLALADLLPFVEAIGGDEAAA